MDTEPNPLMQRAEDKTQTSISLRKEILKRAKEEAAREGRSFSNWVEQVIKQKLPDPPPDTPPLPRRPRRRGKAIMNVGG